MKQDLTEEEQHHHLQARNGDHLLTLFQCDLCTFQNLTLHNPIMNSPKDDLLLYCLRRVNLDATWGREPATVAATLHGALQMDH
jgi:hypothetical protein